MKINIKKITIFIISFIIGFGSVRIYKLNNTTSLLINANTQLKQTINDLQEVIILQKTEIDELEKLYGYCQDKDINNMNIESIFKLAAKVYDVDFKLVYAIARLETGNFKSDGFVNKNNAGGMMVDGKLLTYPTVSEGVFEMVRNIKRNYIDKGLVTVEQINTKYCPNESSWAAKVRQIMAEL